MILILVQILSVDVDDDGHELVVHQVGREHVQEEAVLLADVVSTGRATVAFSAWRDRCGRLGGFGGLGLVVGGGGGLFDIVVLLLIVREELALVALVEADGGAGVRPSTLAIGDRDGEGDAAERETVRAVVQSEIKKKT